MIDQNSLRHEIKTKRSELAPNFIAAQSQLFLGKIQAYFHAKPMQKIAIYFAHKGEVDLSPSIEWLWSQGHLLYAPIIKDEVLAFCPYTKTSSFVTNQYGIREPKPHEFIATESLDVVLVPLVAFDRQGHRLGMGKGYYDRSFAFRKQTKKPILIGAAYAFQEVPELEVKAHDISMDLILISS